MPKAVWKWLAVALLVLIAGWAIAAPTMPIPKISLGIDSAKDPKQVSSSLQILALLTVLSVAPALFILTTAFTRIVIILGFVRSALGTMNIPPTQVIVGLSLFLTFYVMGPTWNEMHRVGLKPYMEGKIDFDVALKRTQKPLKDFMLKNTYERDLQMFMELRNEKPRTRDDVNILSLIPAFIISELKTAFIIGFYIFVPFIVIDLIVSSTLMSMGMMMLPPVVVSLPAKLLIFVLADGWSVLVQAIVSGFK